jgi:hypothetical protein
MQMHSRIARLQRAEKILVVADLQVGMEATLQQDSRAAELEHLVDFFVDFLERQDVAVSRAERPVERAEGTILGAEIRVVDVAVDLVGHDARVVLLQAHLVRFHADADEVVGFQHFERLLFRESQDGIPFSEPPTVCQRAPQLLIQGMNQAVLRPYRFTASDFAAAHSIVPAFGIKPSLAACSK